MLFDSHPEISNMIAETITRRVVIQLMGKKQFDDKFFTEILYVCIGFSTYFLVTKNLIPNNFSHPYMNSAIETCKKWGTFLIVEAVLSGTKIDNNFIINLINTLIGVSVYHLVIEKYLDDNNFDESTKEAIFFLTKDLVVNILSGRPLNINSPDLIGIFIYHNYVQKNISF